MNDRFAHLSFRHWRDRFLWHEFAKRYIATFATIQLIDRVFSGLSQQFSTSIHLHLAVALAFTLLSLRPRKRYKQKISGKDIQISIEIRSAFDILDGAGSSAALVVPCNTTFETDLHGRIPVAPSIQGQFTRRFYGGNPNELEREISRELATPRYAELTEVNVGYNNRDSFPIGTVVQIKRNGRLFYLLASSRINEHGRAETTETDLDLALVKLWDHIGGSGDYGEVIIPLIGTRHGRVNTSRESAAKKAVASFIESTKVKSYCSKLIVAIFPSDVNSYEMNLSELHEYLNCATKFM